MTINYTINGLDFTADIEINIGMLDEVTGWEYEETPFYTNREIEAAIDEAVNELYESGVIA